jgi:hypothetical protein
MIAGKNSPGFPPEKREARQNVRRFRSNPALCFPSGKQYSYMLRYLRKRHEQPGGLASFDTAREILP